MQLGASNMGGRPVIQTEDHTYRQWQRTGDSNNEITVQVLALGITLHVSSHPIMYLGTNPTNSFDNQMPKPAEVTSILPLSVTLHPDTAQIFTVTEVSTLCSLSSAQETKLNSWWSVKYSAGFLIQCLHLIPCARLSWMQWLNHL